MSKFKDIRVKLRRHIYNIDPTPNSITVLVRWCKISSGYKFIYSKNGKEIPFCLNDEEGRIWGLGIEPYEKKGENDD